MAAVSLPARSASARTTSRELRLRSGWVPAASRSPATIELVDVARAAGLFLAAALAEIGGGYLVWRWLREGGRWWVGAIGALVLVGYGVIPTLQRHASFGRVYAAYGGVFVVMSLLWGWGVDAARPDRYDWLGAGIVTVGVIVIFFAPRRL